MALQTGVAARPVALPRYRKAAPLFATPPSYSGAPTMTSSKVSPFTSPADATDVPNPAAAWSPRTAQSTPGGSVGVKMTGSTVIG